jgi:hypothetical protein
MAFSGFQPVYRDFFAQAVALKTLSLYCPCTFDLGKVAGVGAESRGFEVVLLYFFVPRVHRGFEIYCARRAAEVNVFPERRIAAVHKRASLFLQLVRPGLRL